MSGIWFTIIIQPLYNLLIVFYKYLGHDMGVAIIVLTIIIRLIFWPSQAKALRSQKELANLQPEIEKVREQYKNDPQKQSQEIMALYRMRKISPLSGCLPILIQFPILIGLYNIFRSGLKIENFKWLYGFISKPAFLNINFLHFLDLSKPEKIFLPILAGVTQFLLAWLSQPAKRPEGEKKPADFSAMMSKQMLFFFPILIVFVSMSLPAALALYWIVTNIFMIIQQIMINKGSVAQPKVTLKVSKK